MVSTSEVSGIATWTNSVDQREGPKRNSLTDDGGSENYSGASQATANLQ